MVGRGRGRGRGRGNQPQQTELAELRRMVEDLTRAVQALQRQELMEARMENPEGDHEQLENLDLEIDEELEDVNPFHEAGPANYAARGGLEQRLLHAIDLNGGGIKLEVADFHGKLHAEDYLDWEANLDNYFEWKTLEENRKVLFVKLKLKGTALQWWKRVEEQRARQGKPKISTWEHMKAKLRKQFLPADYTMELYEKFHGLKQNNMSVEEYTAEFNNLSIRVGLSESNEQITSRYLCGLNNSIRDEIGVVHLFNLEDARQYALSAEKRVTRYES